MNRTTTLGLCLVALVAALGAAAEEPPRAAVAWFTNATVEESVRIAAPEGIGLPPAKGGWGAAVQLTTAVPVGSPVLSREDGYISFWIRPDWNGNDGKTHRLLRIGDPAHNGLLVEKSAKNMLRYVMASPGKVTAARADVSHWKAGEWHHVAIAWFSRGDMPIGLPLWIDKVAVDGPLAAGNTFLDPDAMDDARVWIGDESSETAMEELVMRVAPTTERERGQVDLVYRDYFRTAPVTQIAVDAEPHAVPADRRVVEGAHKQFGLQGRLNGRWERLTDFVNGYGNWADFDAKPLIAWTTSNEAIATADENGRVEGHAVGRCTLTAAFRGLKASYDVRVIPVEQPDLDLYVVELLPRYLEMALKNHHEPGDVVRSVARIANFGYEPTPARVPVTFEIIPDANGNYRLDANERPIVTKRATIDKPLQPLDETALEFEWTWPEAPVWVRVTVDPGNRVREISEANNRLFELNTAKPVIWGYVGAVLKHDHAEKRINLTGSFSYYDWMRTESDRARLMLREAVYPTTSPAGVLDDIRVDEFVAYNPEEGEKSAFEQRRVYHDGGFPIGDTTSEHLAYICSPLVHELGHTMLALPDLYGHPCLARNVFITDENGEPYAGGPLLPQLNDWGGIMVSPGQGVECGVSYAYLMDYCHMWLHPAHAGQVQYYHALRGPRFWGVQGLLIPTSRHELLVLDVNDEPLEGAAVYCYHTTHMDAEDGSAKFFADRPKYIGHTNEEGRYEFPGQTDEHWDSPETDEVDGAIDAWNPFGLKTKDTAFTPNCWGAEGMMLLKIVSGDRTEFHWLTLTMMNEEFFKGAKNWGIYTIRTSLTSAGAETPVVQREVPEAIRKTNLKPVARIDIQPVETDAQPEITAKLGEPIRIDGSQSADPEGRPLIYRWHAQGPFEREDCFSDKPVYEGKAPLEETGDFTILFYVIDGVRASDTIRVKVHVVAGEEAPAESGGVE